MNTRHLYLDWETAGRLDIETAGTDNYLRNAKPLMLGWAVDDNPVQIWFPPAAMPDMLHAALLDETVLKIAWHAAFERLGLLYFCKMEIPIEQWRDVMILGRHLSLPGKLDAVCDILKMSEDTAKIKDGDRLIELFCKPNGDEGHETLYGVSDGFADPREYPEDWAAFIRYCRRDVEVERKLYKLFSKLTFPEEYWQHWFNDQKMNQVGIPFNVERAKKCHRLALRYKKEAKQKMNELTGLENANSRKQLLEWLETQGYKLGSINKQFVEPLLKNPDGLTPLALEVLKLRRKSAQNSYTKIARILEQISPDNRLRNQFIFMGAARTGRWSSAGINVQNLPRPVKAFKNMPPERIFDLIDREAYDEIKKEFEGSTLPFVASSLRMLKEAPPGYRFIVCDLSAIEHRIVGWLSRCEAILNCHEQKHDPYLDFAVYLYPSRGYVYDDIFAKYEAKDPAIEEVRQLAKPPVLGGGFGLGGGELKVNEFGDEVRTGMWGYALNVCGVDMPQALAHRAVKIYREINWEVPKFWEDMEKAFKWVLTFGGEITVGEVTWDRYSQQWEPVAENCTGAKITFSRVKSKALGYIMRMKLPSGRYLHYINARIEKERVKGNDGKPWVRDVIIYDGIEHSAVQEADGSFSKKSHKWGPTKTYGGKLCLAGNTQVLTNRGIISIADVQEDDKLWDGRNWINHSGLVYKGEKDTITWMGLTATPDHEILAGNEWRELGRAEIGYTGLISRWTGLVSVLRLCYSQCLERKAELVYSAIVEPFLKLIRADYGETKFNRVHPALTDEREKNEAIITLLKTIMCDERGYTEGLESSPAAATLLAKCIQITGDVELQYTSYGRKVPLSGYDMYQACRDGITQIWMWIESTMMEIMSPEISASLRDKKIQTIEEALSTLSIIAKKFHILTSVESLFQDGAKTLYTIIYGEGGQRSGVSKGTERRKVYDLLNCGINHRFTVITPFGPLVVHNCENATQAVACDVLMNGVNLAWEKGFQIFGVYHDEGAAIVHESSLLGVEDLRQCLNTPPKWGPTLLLDSAGWEGTFYKKN